jgi:hypothetical protein
MNPTTNPYDAPEVSHPPEAPAPPRRAARRALRNAAIALVVSVGVAAITCWGPISTTQPMLVLQVGVLVWIASAAIGASLAAFAVVRALRGPGFRILAILGGASLFLAQGALALYGAFLTQFLFGGGRGRQIRRFGRVLVPRLRAGDDWSRAPDAASAGRAMISATPSATARIIDVDSALGHRVATAWRENAKTEHASVSAFARLTLDLMALGAPPDLLVESQKDALDEIAHARLCLALAATIDGEHESPAPFPAVRYVPALTVGRSMALTTLAITSLVDGVLHEGVSARVIAKLARVAEAPEIRNVLSTLAADEGRHAAHAWNVVDWCVREGGEVVIGALQGAARAIPEARKAHLPPGGEDGSWERWGIPGEALDAAEYDRARKHLVQRVSALAQRAA